jgi:hypothetical protein
VSPVLDVAARLLLIRVERGVALSRSDHCLQSPRWDLLPGKLAELGVDTLICGAVSQPLACALNNQGVQVTSNVCGEVEEVLQAFLNGQLDQRRFRMPGCRAQRATNKSISGNQRRLALARNAGRGDGSDFQSQIRQPAQRE